MEKITVKIDGMMCGMCESHMNECIRNNFPVSKVTSSHGKGETVVISEAPLDEAKLKEAIDNDIGKEKDDMTVMVYKIHKKNI